MPHSKTRSDSTPLQADIDLLISLARALNALGGELLMAVERLKQDKFVKKGLAGSR